MAFDRNRRIFGGLVSRVTHIQICRSSVRFFYSFILFDEKQLSHSSISFYFLLNFSLLFLSILYWFGDV